MTVTDQATSRFAQGQLYKHTFHIFMGTGTHIGQLRKPTITDSITSSLPEEEALYVVLPHFSPPGTLTRQLEEKAAGEAFRELMKLFMSWHLWFPHQ